MDLPVSNSSSGIAACRSIPLPGWRHIRTRCAVDAEDRDQGQPGGGRRLRRRCLARPGAAGGGAGRLGRYVPPAQAVRRRLRAGARRVCRGGRRSEADRGRDQRHADLARPAFELSRHREISRHAGADPRRVRRARHRGHDGERPGQGRLADRRHAGRQGRRAARRLRHPHRRRGRDGPVAERGGREDARPGRQQDRPAPAAQGPGRAVRRQPEPRGDQDLAGARPGRGRRRLCPADHLQRADRDRDARQARAS